MSIRKVGFWGSTGLVAAGFLFSGFADVLMIPRVVEGMQQLGYPPYFATLLGVWKLLGAAAILAPRLPRLKEWAYAGMFFDLTGAVVSHAAVGDGLDKLAPPLFLLMLLITSWYLRPAERVLGGSLRASPARQEHGALAHGAA